MKKEKELAEKRKNDPPLELASDHPVRKLISRFRKVSETKHAQPNHDLERGHVNPSLLGSKAETRLINVSESSSQFSAVPRLGGGASKWGKFLGGGGSTPKIPEIPQNGNNNIPDAIPKNIKEVMKPAEPPKPVLKPASRWGKFMAKPSEPVQGNSHTSAVNPKTNLRKTDSTDSGILRSDVKLDQIGDGSDSSTTRDTVASTGSTLSAVEQQMLTSLYDIRLEMKEEMEHLSHKINRIDDQISEILRLFSPSSSPCSSRVSTYPNSRYSTFNSSTENNSAGQSPKSSQPSSPHRTSLENIPETAIISPKSQGSKSPSHRGSPDSGSSGRSVASVITGAQGAARRKSTSSSDSTGKASVSSLPESGPSSRHNSTRGKPKESRVTKLLKSNKVADTSLNVDTPKDDEDTPVKDRDLDIL